MRTLLLLVALLGAVASQAQVLSLDNKVNFDKAAITLNFAKLGMQATDIKATPIAGLVQVLTDKGLFYMSTDGNYLMQGRLFNFEAGMVNETDKALASVRVNGLETFKNDVIEYKAKNEKHIVTVFTDITCGYCRKLHNEMKQYNDLGITVRYLAFPRAGVNAPSFNDMRSVWCADNPQKAMDEAKAGSNIAAKTCQDTIESQYLFGQQVGVTGTPAIILQDGTVQPGYVPAARLITLLEQG